MRACGPKPDSPMTIARSACRGGPALANGSTKLPSLGPTLTFPRCLSYDRYRRYSGLQRRARYPKAPPKKREDRSCRDGWDFSSPAPTLHRSSSRRRRGGLDRWTAFQRPGHGGSAAPTGAAAQGFRDCPLNRARGAAVRRWDVLSTAPLRARSPETYAMGLESAITEATNRAVCLVYLLIAVLRHREENRDGELVQPTNAVSSVDAPAAPGATSSVHACS